MALLAGNTTSKLALAALGIALALTPMIAEAKGGHGPRASFEELDANGDGALTQVEMQAYGKARIAAADTDGDGDISWAELEAHIASKGQGRMERRIDRMMDRMDADKDGVISAAEIETASADRSARRANRGFERADADGNGSISKAEFEAMAKKFGKRHGSGKGRDAD